jgi:hypothetical protein
MRILLVIASLSLFLFSCKNTTRDSSKKYQFNLNPPTGAKYYFNINTETISHVSVNGREIETNNQSEVGLIYEVVKSSPDSIQIKITYDQLKFSLKNKDGEKEIDAANSGHSFDNQEKQLAAIKGASMNLILNKKGNVLLVAGGNEIADKLIATLNATSPASQARVREQFNKFIGEDFVKNNLASQFKLFPDTAVAVGDTWKQENTLSTEIEVKASTNFVFDDLDGNIATVKSTAIINTDNKTTIMGNEVEANIKGNQESEFETDIATGLLMKAETSTSIDGSMQMMGKDIPLSIKITKHIDGKKL